MESLLYCCCGVDVHSEMIEACIIRGIDEPEYIRKQFSAYAQGLTEFVKWLGEYDCYNTAMESTGVYWRSVYEAIEESGEYYESIIVCNAQHMRNVPGRKSDVDDAEWIATLFRHGLLKASFVPDRVIRDLREYSRLYKNLISEKSRYVNRTEKFLQTHGFKLSSVLSDIFTVSGWKLLNLLASKGMLTITDVEQSLARNVKKTPEEVRAAMCGRLSFSSGGDRVNPRNKLRVSGTPLFVGGIVSPQRSKCRQDQVEENHAG